MVDLEKGQYLILTTATWLPNQDNYLKSSGYVSYIFRVNYSDAFTFSQVSYHTK